MCLLFLLPGGLRALRKVDRLAGSSGLMVTHDLALINSWHFNVGYDILSSFAKVQAVSLFFTMKYLKIMLLLPLSVYLSGEHFLIFKEKLK